MEPLKPSTQARYLMKSIFIQPKGLGHLLQPMSRKRVRLESKKSFTSLKIWENHSNLFKIIFMTSNGATPKQPERMRRLLIITSNPKCQKTTSSREFSTHTKTQRLSVLSHTILRSISTNLISSMSNKKFWLVEITLIFQSNLCTYQKL